MAQGCWTVRHKVAFGKYAPLAFPLFDEGLHMGTISFGVTSSYYMYRVLFQPILLSGAL